MNDLMIPRVVRFFYYPEERMFKTEDKKPVLNLYPLVPPSMVFLFRYNKQTMSYTHPRYHIKTILLYPTKEAL